MDSENGPEDYPTPRFVEAGETLRTLTPPTLAALHLLIDYDMSTQDDMADMIGCTRPSVSRYLQSLEDLPMPLVRKQGHDYTTTEFGEHVFAIIESMLHRLGIDLREIDWRDGDESEKIEKRLTPLYDSRSTSPFLILESIRSRTNLLGTSESVSVEDVVVDVRSRQRDIGKSITAKQIRKILRRFDDKGSVEFDGGQITLTSKGEEHVRLLQQLVQILEDERGKDVDRSTAVSSAESGAGIAHLLDARPFRGDSRMVSGTKANRSVSADLRELPAIVPAFHLVSSGDTEATMLPFASLTVRELVDYANRLGQEYDDDMLLEPYWALRTGTGLSPLGPAQLTLGTFGESE